MKTTDKNLQNIKDITPKKNFIIVYDSVYKASLTIEELGLMTKLISIAPTFKPTSQKLADILHINIKHLTKISKSLQKKGYLTIKKHGKTSEWLINQEPINSALKDFTKESLLNALINFEITMEQLKILHKLKYIDDRLFIATTTAYANEIKRIVKTKWLEDE